MSKFFKPGSWYFIKSKRRRQTGGPDDQKYWKGFIPLFFKVESVLANGDVAEISDVHGNIKRGPQHRNCILIDAYMADFFKEFVPSGNVRFEGLQKYRAIDSGIDDVLRNMHRGYTRFRNFVAGNSMDGTGNKIFVHATGDDGSLRWWSGEHNGKKSGIGGYVVTCQEFKKALPAELAMFFATDEQIEDRSEREALEELDLLPPDPQHEELSEMVKTEIAKKKTDAMNDKHRFAVTAQDLELLNAVKYLLNSSDIFAGKRTRLAYMEETYVRDRISSAADIIDLAEARKEEIAKYREVKERDIQSAQEQIEKIDQL